MLRKNPTFGERLPARGQNENFRQQLDSFIVNNVCAMVYYDSWGGWALCRRRSARMYRSPKALDSCCMYRSPQALDSSDYLHMYIHEDSAV